MSHRSVHRLTLPRSPRGLARRYDRGVPHQKRHVKRATFRDCGRRCVYCATPLGLEAATLDHVIPLSRGGNHAPGNLVAACVDCKSGVRNAVRLTWKRTLKHQVWRACEGHCVYCGSGLEIDNLTIDHVIPASAGGATNLLNCVASCRRCNQKKASRPLHDFILQSPEVGQCFLRFARQVARAQKRVARRAVSLAYVELAA